VPHAVPALYSVPWTFFIALASSPPSQAVVEKGGSFLSHEYP
jgi:hypothetical protein